MATDLARKKWFKLVMGAIAGTSLGMAFEKAFADPGPQTTTGLPVSVIPTAPEPGLPAFSYPAGGPSGVGGGDGSGSGSGTSGDTGAGGGSGSGGSGTLPANATLEQVASQDYIQQAAALAGISPEALAATCMAESQCQNLASKGGSQSASGVFQMTNSTYTQMINEFAKENPDIQVDTSLAGKMDPQNEAYAAAQYLADGVSALQDKGIADPTNVDVRGYYQFGAGLGAAVAKADPTQSIESIVNLSPGDMVKNGITSTTTVGQWRQTYANQVGAVAYNPAGA